jgi:hypothetical protein
MLHVGWPFRAMASGYRYEKRNDRNQSVSTTGVQLWSIELNGILNRLSTPLKLPTRVLPVGFTGNSLIYVSTFACFVAYRRFRRGGRAKHGQCVKCKYPLGTSQGCPECGTPSLIQVGNSQSKP